MNSTPTMSDDDVFPDEAPEATEAADPAVPTDVPTTPRRRLRDLRWTLGHPDGIVTGLSADLAERLMIDPLWVRLSFVVSALFGGLGLLIYAGLWLALIVARSTALRVAGAAIVVVSFLALADSDVGFSTGPLTVIGLLAGLAVTLWKPVPTWADGDDADPTAGPSNSWATPAGSPAQSIDQAAALDDTGAARWAVGADHSVAEQWNGGGGRRFRPTVVRPQRRVRPPSLLGRSTFGLALIVAAVGALIDELNGGRLHPEQWLGAAAIVCGLGLLIGVVRGQARWLIVPAMAFAALGYGGGVLARIGVQPSDAFASNSSWAGNESSGPYRAYTGFGSIWVQATEVLDSPITIDVRTAAGMNLTWDQDVAVEIRSRLGEVTMRLDGNATTGTTLRLGPDGPPDMIIDLRMVRGIIEVTDVAIYEAVPRIDEELFQDGPLDIEDRVRLDGTRVGPIVDVEEGIAVTSDGWIILNGDVILDEFNNVNFGDWYSPDEQSILITTEIGEYRIVGPVLFTPDGRYFDLDALRRQALESPAAVEEIAPPADLEVEPSTPFDPEVTDPVAPITVATQDTNGIDE